MSAWITIVLPICFLTKCGIDFLVLEYGSKFQFISDDQFLNVCILIFGYALFVDAFNFLKVLKRRR